MRESQPPERIDPKSLDDYLEVMSKAVFQSGMSWSVVEAKWPGTRPCDKVIRGMGFGAGTNGLGRHHSIAQLLQGAWQRRF